MFSNQLRKCLLRVVTLQQLGDFDRFCWLVQCGPRWSDLEPSNHVLTDNGEECSRTRADMRPEFLLQDLQEVAFRKVHLENGVKLVVPPVRFGADGHRQRNEVLRRHFWNVGHHAPKVADLFKNANVATEDMDIQLQGPPPRSRRSSSRVPETPISVKLISRPRTASTAKSLREPNSDTCPRSKRTRDSLVIPERRETSLWFIPRVFRLLETASPSSASVCICDVYITLVNVSSVM